MAIDTFIVFKESDSMLKVLGETQDTFFKKGGPGGQDRGAFELKDWSFEITNKSTIGSATQGAGGGKAEFDVFTISKPVDAASPAFFQNCVAGAHYLTVTLACRKAGQGKAVSGGPYLVYQFGTVFTTKVSWSHDDEGPKEEITFVYGELIINYRIQAKDGSFNTAPITSQWSVLNNTSNNLSFGPYSTWQ
jgi:type VI secretion system secreted protein Hcp